MAANTATSSTGTVTGTDPNFVLTYKTNSSEGVYLMIKYTIGTSGSLAITLDSIVPSLSASDKYRHITLSGSTASAYTLTFSAAGNYRIPISIIDSEKTICANITFGSSGADAACVANFMEG